MKVDPHGVAAKALVTLKIHESSDVARRGQLWLCSSTIVPEHFRGKHDVLDEPVARVFASPTARFLHAAFGPTLGSSSIIHQGKDPHRAVKIYTCLLCLKFVLT